MESPIPEIFEMILSHFDGDKDKHALKACVLVSHTWLQLTRPYLFRSMTVKGDHPQKDFAAFIQLLRSPGNGVAFNLSKLDLISCISFTECIAHWQLSVSTLYSILSLLPALHYLTLNLINMPLDLGFTPPVPRVSIRLRRLDISHLQVSATAFFTMFSFFESIDELRIFVLLPALDDPDTDVETYSTQYCVPHVQISSLALTKDTPIGICSSLLDMYFQNRPSGSITTHSRTLKVSTSGPNSLENILKIRDQIRARHAEFQLQRIDLNVYSLYLTLGRRPDGEVQTVDWARLHLTSHDTLSSLGLTIPCGPFPWSRTNEIPMISWTCFSEILTAVPTTILQLSIRLSILCNTIESTLSVLEECGWDRMKPALVRFAALERVTVWVYVVDVESPREGGRQAEQLVKAKLRALKEACPSLTVDVRLETESIAEGMRWTFAGTR